MIAYNDCPGCGLRLGYRRRETPGELYRCRRCKSVLLFEKRARSGECLFSVKPEGAAQGRPLQTIPRV